MQDVSSILVPSAIAIIMLGIGLNLTIYNFKRVFVKPKAILTGLTLQMVLLPLTGFIIAYLWDMTPEYKAGLVLVASCPGGTASNLVTNMLKGRVALSISLTAFNSLLILFTIPALVSFSISFFLGMDKEISLSFWETFFNLSFTVIAPVIVGMIIRHYFKSFVQSLKKPLRYILPGILIVVFIVVSFDSSGESSFQDILKFSLILPALLLNLITILLGFFLSGLMKINHEGRYTIAIEMGLQNSALAIFISNQLLENTSMSMMAILYSSFSFFTTWGLAYLLKKYFRPKEA